VGHNLNAFILKGDFDRARAAEFDLRRVSLPFDLTLFPVVDGYIDAWADRLGIHGSFPEPACNFLVVHHMMKSIAVDPLFAVIGTDYFGGLGGQAAGAYHGDQVVLEPSSSEDSINTALRLLGVARESGKDEFDTIGLRTLRDTRDCFGDGYED
jgi:hypothetical protein